MKKALFLLADISIVGACATLPFVIRYIGVSAFSYDMEFLITAYTASLFGIGGFLVVSVCRELRK